MAKIVVYAGNVEKSWVLSQETAETIIQEQNKQEERLAEAYQKGLEDAWEIARSIVTGAVQESPILEFLRNEFGTMNIQIPFSQCSASEILEKYQTWEHERDELQVGDEVMFVDGSERLIVIRKEENGKIKAINSLGYIYNLRTAEILKTGKQYELIIELLNQLKEE